jgi:AcrR family transcriptional regulator
MVKPNGSSKKPNRKAPVRTGATEEPAKAAAAANGPGHSDPDRTVDTEKRILSAARGEFIAKGLDGARMQVIATEAGVNKALLHYYYRSKDKLYQKVLEDIVGTVWGRLQEEFRSQDRPEGLETLIRTVVATYMRTLRANPEFPLFVFRAMSTGSNAIPAAMEELAVKFKDVPATLIETLKREIKAGKIKPVNPAHFLMNMMGMTVSTFLIMPMLRKLGPAFGVNIEFDEAFQEERIASITDTLLNGIRNKR